jgi:hypothetical protein
MHKPHRDSKTRCSMHAGRLNTGAPLQAAHLALRRCHVYLALLVLPSCIALPRTVQDYDPHCQIKFKQMRLDVETYQLGDLLRCNGNKACLPVLAVVSGVSAASMVISGSIVVVGNTVYWLEKRGRCLAGPTPMSNSSDDLHAGNPMNLPPSF